MYSVSRVWVTAVKNNQTRLLVNGSHGCANGNVKKQREQNVDSSVNVKYAGISAPRRSLCGRYLVAVLTT